MGKGKKKLFNKTILGFVVVKQYKRTETTQGKIVKKNRGLLPVTDVFTPICNTVDQKTFPCPKFFLMSNTRGNPLVIKMQSLTWLMLDM